MPDISMCAQRRCIIKQSCYRFTASPGERQTYFMPQVGPRIAGTVVDDRDAYCEFFMPAYKMGVVKND